MENRKKNNNKKHIYEKQNTIRQTIRQINKKKRQIKHIKTYRFCIGLI